MRFRPRSLVGNSLGSVFASGTLILSAVFVPAILARGFTRPELDLYMAAFAFVPAMLILPQSHRAVSATQLNHLMAAEGQQSAMRAFWRFTLGVGVLQLLLGLAGIAIYTSLYGSTQIGAASLRTGLYCFLTYTLGVLAAGTVVAPAAAQHDFRPDNVAKLWPGLFQLIGLFAVWQAGLSDPLLWAFLVYLASSWSIAIGLVFWVGLPGAPHGAGPDARAGDHSAEPLAARHAAEGGPQPFLLKSLSGVVWWNLTAFLATTAAVMVVAVNHPGSLAPFSIATSLLGIVSAGLIAISGPVALHAASLLGSGPERRRRFYLIVNSLFQGYILLAAAAVAFMPVWLFELWLNAELAADVKLFSLLLLPASILRLLTMAFTIFVMSAGRQHTLWLSPLVEAVLSVAGAIVLGTLLGATGVPLALALSAAIRLLITILHDSPRNREALGFGPREVLLPGWQLARAPRC